MRLSTALMLENQLNYLTEANHTTASLGTDGAYMPAGGTAGNGMFANIAIPMVKRTFPNLIAHEIVGVQPLNGPIGLAFALRYKADQQYNGAGPNSDFGQELGGYNVDPYYSGNQATSGAFTTATGEQLGSMAGAGVGADVGIGVGVGDHIKEVSMHIEKDKVEARTRKLRSRWSIEAAQDIRAMHGLDLESEMMDVLSYEITAEIDRELVGVIRTRAKSNTHSAIGTNGLDWSSLDGR